MDRRQFLRLLPAGLLATAALAACPRDTSWFEPKFYDVHVPFSADDVFRDSPVLKLHGVAYMQEDYYEDWTIER